MRRFICRICGELRKPAFPESHSCADCWAEWEARLDEFPADSSRQGTPAAPTRHGPALPVRVTLAVVAESGGHWCMQCQHYVSPVISDQGLPNRCPHCDGFHLRFDPPVPGYSRAVA